MQINRMTSTLNTQNTSAKGSKVPVQLPDTNASTVRENVSGAQAKKPPYESKKSAEELKLRLASAVSAKIALSKDGRNSSSNTSSNRGIGFLLQRKEQQENKLNTKDISFQKPLRNQGGKPAEMTGKNPNNSTKNVNKSELQKSLLSALMNSRGTPPNRSNDTRGRLNSDTNNTASVANKLNETPASTPKATSNVANKSSNGRIQLGQNRDSRFANTTKLNPSATNKTKNTVSESNNKPLSTVKTKSEDSSSKSLSEFPNGTKGGILDRAKNIERLLSQRKSNIAVESTNEAKNVAVSEKEKNIEANNVNGKINDNVKLNKTTSTAKAKDVSTIKPLAFLGKERDSFINGQSNGVFALNKSTKTNRSFENTAREKKEHSNGLNKRKFDSNRSVEARKPFENSGKKIPPPVAKKPSKENMNGQSFVTSANSNVKISTDDPSRSAGKINSPTTQGNTSGLKVNELRFKNESALLLNGANSAKDVGFREDLLEKLEADVGRCKIAAFQSMEEFSALRMKVYRIRGELDQLKREREKRTALVC